MSKYTPGKFLLMSMTASPVGPEFNSPEDAVKWVEKQYAGSNISVIGMDIYINDECMYFITPVRSVA